jgi:hypothetical protein
MEELEEQERERERSRNENSFQSNDIASDKKKQFSYFCDRNIAINFFCFCESILLFIPLFKGSLNSGSSSSSMRESLNVHVFRSFAKKNGRATHVVVMKFSCKTRRKER